MASDVEIKLGARIDELEEKLDQAKNKIHELEDETHSTAEAFKEIGKIALEAFGVSSIIGLIEKMAELGKETQKTMALLGTTAEETSRLRFVAEATGVSFESMTTVVERLALNVQKASIDS